MKQFNLKTMFSLLLALTMLFSLSVPAFAAESTVTFEDGKVIAFAPGSVYTSSDLFDNFKGLMPGDSRIEEITIRNNTKDCDYIKVYLRALPHDESGNPISPAVLAELTADERRDGLSQLGYMLDFLSQLSLTVWHGTTQIYQESPDALDGLAGNVYLGSIRKGETIKLSAELKAPIELGNEYSDRIGEVDWVFVVEGFDDPEDNLIQTGQLSWPIPVMGGLGLLLIVYGFMVMKKRKNEEAE